MLAVRGDPRLISQCRECEEASFCRFAIINSKSRWPKLWKQTGEFRKAEKRKARISNKNQETQWLWETFEVEPVWFFILAEEFARLSEQHFVNLCFVLFSGFLNPNFGVTKRIYFPKSLVLLSSQHHSERTYFCVTRFRESRVQVDYRNRIVGTFQAAHT